MLAIQACSLIMGRSLQKHSSLMHIFDVIILIINTFVRGAVCSCTAGIGE
jgi:hypothetical protein